MTPLTPPLVSVVLPVYRPGGFDITFAGLAAQTFKDFEVIIVDNRYERRHTSVLLFAERYGLRVVHAPEHRRNGQWIAAAMAFNTGFALARGKYIVTLTDYSYAPPELLDAVILHLEQHPRRLLTMPYEHRELPEVRGGDTIDFQRAASIRRCTEPLPVPVLDELAIFKAGLFAASWLPAHPVATRKVDGSAIPWGDDRPRGRGLVTVDERSVFMRVEAAHREFVYELNGIDERYQRGRTGCDWDFGRRACNVGEVVFHSDATPVAYFNPHWLLWTKPFGDVSVRVPDRWNDADCYTYLKRRRDARRAANPFDLRQLAIALESWRDPNAVCVPQDIPDIAYWRHDIQPDTPMED